LNHLTYALTVNLLSFLFFSSFSLSIYLYCVMQGVLGFFVEGLMSADTCKEVFRKEQTAT
jgi:hypothetical protein